MPVGRLTTAMTPEDEVKLRRASLRGATAAKPRGKRRQKLSSGLEPTFAVIQSKCLAMEEGDVLLASEVLKPGYGVQKEFAVLLGALGEVDPEFVPKKRKSFKEEAKQELEMFQRKRKAE